MSWEKPIIITPNEEFLVVSSVRYARGRATYIVEMTCEWVINHWEQLSEKTRAVIARDVRCRWHPCDQEATHHDPPLCPEHHKARAERLRGPLFIPPKETPDD